MNNSKKQLPCSDTVRRKRKASQSYDHIWDAIPLFELLGHAVEQSSKCCPNSEIEIRECARNIVRNNICFCCRSEVTIVESITDEFIRQMEKTDQKSCADDLELFRREKEHENYACSSWQNNETIAIRIRTRPSQNERPGKNK